MIATGIRVVELAPMEHGEKQAARVRFVRDHMLQEEISCVLTVVVLE